MSASDGQDEPKRLSASQLSAGLERLTQENYPAGWNFGSRLRNYFLTGLVIVGPVTITLYFAFSPPFVPEHSEQQ